MEMSLKDSSSRVRESLSMDSLAIGTVLLENNTDDPAPGQQMEAAPHPKTCLYLLSAVEFVVTTFLRKLEMCGNFTAVGENSCLLYTSPSPRDS